MAAAPKGRVVYDGKRAGEVHYGSVDVEPVTNLNAPPLMRHEADTRTVVDLKGDELADLSDAPHVGGLPPARPAVHVKGPEAKATCVEHEHGYTASVAPGMITNRLDVIVKRPPMGWQWQAPAQNFHPLSMGNPDVAQWVTMMIRAADKPGTGDDARQIGVVEREMILTSGRIDLLTPVISVVTIDGALVPDKAAHAACVELAKVLDCLVFITGAAPGTKSEPAELPQPRGWRPAVPVEIINQLGNRSYDHDAEVEREKAAKRMKANPLGVA